MAILERLIEKIRANGDDVSVAGGRPPSAIKELERALGVTLPPSYRAFLTRYGGLTILDSVVSGICGDNPLEMATGWLYADTILAREDDDFPEHFLVIQPDEDAPYCLDLSTTDDRGENPVISYDLPTKTVEKINDSFGEWLTECLKLQAE